MYLLWRPVFGLLEHFQTMKLSFGQDHLFVFTPTRAFCALMGYNWSRGFGKAFYKTLTFSIFTRPNDPWDPWDKKSRYYSMLLHTAIGHLILFLFVSVWWNWLRDQGRAKEAEERVVHVAHDHQATRDAAETQQKSLHWKRIKLHRVCIHNDCDTSVARIIHLMGRMANKDTWQSKTEPTPPFFTAHSQTHTLAPKAAWTSSPCIGLPCLHISHPICEGGHTRARMTRPYSSSSPPAAVVGQKTASQAWQQLCTGWLADNKDAAHAHARKQVQRACVERTDRAHAWIWRGRRKAALQRTRKG